MLLLKKTFIRQTVKKKYYFLDFDAKSHNKDNSKISTVISQSGVEEQQIRVPVCPNGLNAMQYSDGRPVMCLPGLNQCPDKSVCFYNGLDYFCCPNEDDPYDHHIFGGILF